MIALKYKRKDNKLSFEIIYDTIDNVRIFTAQTYFEFNISQRNILTFFTATNIYVIFHK